MLLLPYFASLTQLSSTISASSFIRFVFKVRFTIQLYGVFCTQLQSLDSVHMWNQFLLHGSVVYLLDDVSTNTPSKRTQVIPSGGAGGELWYPFPYSAEDYTRFDEPKIDTRRFAILLSRMSFTIHDGYE